ncbi:hypothetical protein [Mogibacterium diversum]|jgi:hypothetical protein|uniref:hypothetical protein n=1 Tax=Mogibacterium diversum TaxID=114527 RepID=UPI002F4036AE
MYGSAVKFEKRERNGKAMKLTRHNGRAGKNGAYSVKHNDRNFEAGNSDHIDSEMSKFNVCTDIINL